MGPTAMRNILDGSTICPILRCWVLNLLVCCLSLVGLVLLCSHSFGPYIFFRPSVSMNEELAGMDISRHNGAGYQKEQENVSLDASISLSQKRRCSLADLKSRKSGIEELQVVPDDEA